MARGSRRKRKLTLALGGGGARGVSHLGVIETLLAAEFSIERVVGVSIGSLAGALYAFDPNIDSVIEKTLGYLLSERFQHHQQTLFGAKPGAGSDSGGLFSWYDRVKSYLRGNRLFHRVVTKPSLLPGIVLNDVVDHLLPDADLRDAQIPLSIVSVDLLSGQQVILERGPVKDAVRASSSLPGIFPPVEFEGMLLADIGVFCSLPTIISRSYSPELLLAVDVSSDLRRLEACETAIDVLMRMDEIGEALFRKHVLSAADFVIRPEVSTVEWFDFTACERLIDAGRKATRAALPRLKSIATE
ncbi:MAG: patatin-like phospholipase family protein [Planctomycetota bacterium]|nr:patatin-like phospholipase family protein [Planctomycetota bacterium]